MQIGTQVVLQAKFRDREGQLADPDVATSWIKKRTASTGASLTFTRKSLGVYESLYVPVEDGEHIWRVEATGAVTVAEEKSFEVAVRRVPHA